MTEPATTQEHLPTTYIVRSLERLQQSLGNSDPEGFDPQLATQARNCLSCLCWDQANENKYQRGLRKDALLNSIYNTEDAKKVSYMGGNDATRTFLKIGARILSVSTNWKVKQSMSQLRFDCNKAYRLGESLDDNELDSLNGSTFAQKIEGSTDRYWLLMRDGQGNNEIKNIGEEGLSDRLGIDATTREIEARCKPHGKSCFQLDELTRWIADQPDGTFVTVGDGRKRYDVSDACRSAVTSLRHMFKLDVPGHRFKPRTSLRNGTVLEDPALQKITTNISARAVNDAYLACQVVGRILMLHEGQRSTIGTLSKRRSDWEQGAIISCAIARCADNGNNVYPDLVNSHWLFPIKPETAKLYDLFGVKGDSYSIREVTEGDVRGMLSRAGSAAQIGEAGEAGGSGPLSG